LSFLSTLLTSELAGLCVRRGRNLAVRISRTASCRSVGPSSTARRYFATLDTVPGALRARVLSWVLI
jgi:hypothetical protein